MNIRVYLGINALQRWTVPLCVHLHADTSKVVMQQAAADQF
jgi:hypothetical protein